MIRPSPVEPASPRSAGPRSTPSPAANGSAVERGYRTRAPVEIRTRPSLDVTLTGIVYCAMLLFMGLAAINTQANLLFGVFGLMIGVLLISGIISRWVLRHLTVRRDLPEYAAVGAPMRITYEIDNRKRWWPTLSVTIAELDAPGAFDRQPHAYVMHTAAGHQAVVAAEVVPMRRGLHRLDRYQVTTSFPFGFIRRAMMRRQADAVLVHPAQGAMEPAALTRFLSAESSGISQRPREGGNDEFYGAREYRPGDPVRMIHWRRSARMSGIRTPTAPQGTLIVKQMTRVSPPRLLLLVDTHAPAFAPEREMEREQELAARAAHQQRLADVERNLATAATLLAAATRAGLSVGMIAPAGDAAQGSNDAAKWIDMSPERGKRHSRDMLTAMATVGSNTRLTTEDLVSHGAAQGGGETTVVLITADGGARRAGASAGGPRRVKRGNLMVLRTGGEELDRWVRFSPDLDFTAMAADEA